MDRVFSGQADSNGLPHGYLKMVFDDGSLYEGFARYGKRGRFGRLIETNGNVYVGEWQYDKRHGVGHASIDGQEMKKGLWERDKLVQWFEGPFYDQVNELSKNPKYFQVQRAFAKIQAQERGSHMRL